MLYIYILRERERERDFFGIVACVLQGVSLTPYLFIICLDFVLRTSIDLKKKIALNFKKRQADDTPQKPLRTQTTQMT